MRIMSGKKTDEGLDYRKRPRGPQRRYESVAVMDTVTLAVVSWSDGQLAPGRDQAGMALAEKAKGLAALGRRVDDPAWLEGHLATLDEDASPVDVLATLCAATDGHWSILQAPDGVIEALLGPDPAQEEPLVSGVEGVEFI